MMTFFVDFDLIRLSDRVLNLLLRGTSEGDLSQKTQLVRQVHAGLVVERCVRDENPRSEGPRTIRVELDDGYNETCSDLANLLHDYTTLQLGARRAGDSGRAELIAGAEFLSAIAKSLLGALELRLSLGGVSERDEAAKALEFLFSVNESMRRLSSESGST